VLEQINRPSSRNAGARKTGTGRSRKGNQTVTTTNNGSQSQDSRPTLPQVQLQKSTSGQLAYTQLGDTKANPNSNSATSLPQAMQSQHLSGPHSQSQHPFNQNNKVYQAATREQNSGQQQRRAGLFKVNAASHLVPSSNGATNVSTSNERQLISSGMKPKTDNTFPASHSQSISVNNPSSTGGRTGTQGALRKKMKPYKSNQTNRMPGNTAMPVKYQTNPIEYKKNN